MRLAIPFIVDDDGDVELGIIDVLENLETGYAVGSSHVELLRLCMILSNLSIVEQLLLARNGEESQ